MMYVDDEVIETRENEQPMPFDQLQQKEATGFLLQIVGTLPPRQQEVIQLKFQCSCNRGFSGSAAVRRPDTRSRERSAIAVPARVKARTDRAGKTRGYSRRYFLVKSRAARDRGAPRRLSCGWRGYFQQ
jgi:hypothetical protein